MNLPNKLTIVRVCLIPFFVAALLFDHGNNYTMRIVANVLFIIASLTDLFDGKIARKYNMVTNFGKFMDPLADKLLVCSALICLIELGQLAAWVVIVIISREFIISGFRLVAADNGVVIAASYWGKFKTTFQMIAVILLIFDIPALRMVANITVVIAVALTIISLVDYVATVSYTHLSLICTRSSSLRAISSAELMDSRWSISAFVSFVRSVKAS